jgi:hypothetical protein
MRPIAGLAGLLAALVAVGAAGGGAATPSPSSTAGPIHIVDDAGQHLSLKAPVHRLVVIAPSNFEIVDALGLRSDIVGVDTSVPSYTPAPWARAAHGLPSIGDALPEPSAEAVVARRPQLVITNEPLKIRKERRVALDQRLGTTTARTNPARLDRFSSTRLTHPTTNRPLVQAGRTNHRRLTTTPMRKRLRPSPQPPLTLVQITSQRPVTLPDRTLIDHTQRVLHNPQNSLTYYLTPP